MDTFDISNTTFTETAQAASANNPPKTGSVERSANVPEPPANQYTDGVLYGGVTLHEISLGAERAIQEMSIGRARWRPDPKPAICPGARAVAEVLRKETSRIATRRGMVL